MRGEIPGWHAHQSPGGRPQVQITTPTGHRYRGRAPAPPGYHIYVFSPLTQHFREVLRAA
jgi:hypothetical protein